MYPFCFEFGDRYFPIGPWRLAFRVYSETNVYTPAPEGMQVRQEGARWQITASTYAWAGLQQRLPGDFCAEIWQEGDAIAWSIRARLPERIKGTTTFVRGLGRGEVALPDFSFASVAHGKNDLLQYPYRLKFPICLLKHDTGYYTFAISEDTEVRGKTFAFQEEAGGLLLELHHHEDARKWSMEQETPIWHLGKTSDPLAILARRMRQMEEQWGLRPWEERPDVPNWARNICLVLNLHGAHWTGFVFNHYARQLEILRTVCEQIPGRHVLAFLPGWDGRYNYNWPRYEPDPAMGGVEGLKRLVEGAHSLGVHVIPQIGAQSANRAFLPQGLHDAAFQESYGNRYVKPVEWDNDRMPDTYRIDANIGHPGFRQFLYDKIVGLVERFGFDGIFLDINQAFHNDPRFHVTEGHLDLAHRLHERFDHFLLFGEGWYDRLMAAYPLVHQGPLAQWNSTFERYCRIAYHLNHPAPGRGSTGVYESGFRTPFLPDPQRDIIPTLAFVEDTLECHREAIEAHVEVAKAYGRRKGILP